MKTMYLKLSISMLLVSTVLLFQACSSSSDKAVGSGDAEFQMTDAPTDDANVQAVFVTVSDIKVDGQSVSGFSKQTIDLKAYQEGSTKSLGTFRLPAKTYSTITLVLDSDTDASGNTPGCYVQTTGGGKYRLQNSGTVTIAANNTWNVTNNAKSTIIMDFDIRKAIKSHSDPAVRYTFVSAASLSSSVRVVSQDKAGTVNGTYSEQVNPNADKVFVYAYKKGTYTANETTAQGADGITYVNAVSSAEVKGTAAKTYKLSFLETGEYEMHFARYNKDANDHYVFQGELQSNTSASGSAANLVNIQAGVSASATTTITGL